MKKIVILYFLVFTIFAGCKKASCILPEEKRSFLGLKTEYSSTDLTNIQSTTFFGRLTKTGEFETLDTIGADILKCAYNISTAFDQDHNLYYAYLTDDDPYSSYIANKRIYCINTTTGSLLNTFPVTVKGNIFNMHYNHVNNNLYCMVLDTTYFAPASTIPIRKFYLAQINSADGVITQLSDMFTDTIYGGGSRGLSIDDAHGYANIVFTQNFVLGEQLKIVKFNLNTGIVEDTIKTLIPDELNYYQLLGYADDGNIYIACIGSSGYVSKHSVGADLVIRPVLKDSPGGLSDLSSIRNGKYKYGLRNNTCYPSQAFYNYPAGTFTITEYNFEQNKERSLNYKIAARKMYFGLVPEE